MRYDLIFSRNADKYERDERYENRIDVVVQHMLAAGFEKKRIMEMLGVTKAFVEACNVPGGWLAFV